ncbi:MAG: hypothetical protein DLM54_05170 [Acidimicrobiales bacterium]|nr:MAG: hypothetical protein DLM54_05170 [Acidimicrobiales bacterium]
MSRLVIASSLAGWVGATLLLSQLRWFSRSRLGERLRPYHPAGRTADQQAGLFSVESFGDAVGPLASLIGEHLSRLFGVSEELTARLARIHSGMDVTTFRVRQLGWSLAGLALGGAVTAAARLPVGIALMVVLGSPLLAFLVLEQQVASASARWQRRIFLELPVVAEQLAMLASAGYSLGSALSRIATRGRGACATDLVIVCARVRQGVSVPDALREWAVTARVAALDRLVAVLVLNSETSDLGRLVSEEARAIRRDGQRRQVETMERREQQVWIPVTVATLVPGVIFLAIPFIAALSLFAGS